MKIGTFAAAMVAILAAAGPSAMADDTATSATLKVEFPAPLTAPIVGRTEIKEYVESHGSDILVVNFWATWCIPCVEELPYFQGMARIYKPEQVRILGVSVDLKAQVETAVIPFLNKKEINYPVVVYFGDQQEMIEFFSDGWQGDLPATFIYNSKGEKVEELLGMVSRAQLNAAVEKHLLPEATGQN